MTSTTLLSSSGSVRFWGMASNGKGMGDEVSAGHQQILYFGLRLQNEYIHLKTATADS